MCRTRNIFNRKAGFKGSAWSILLSHIFRCLSHALWCSLPYRSCEWQSLIGWSWMENHVGFSTLLAMVSWFLYYPSIGVGEQRNNLIQNAVTTWWSNRVPLGGKSAEAACVSAEVMCGRAGLVCRLATYSNPRHAQWWIALHFCLCGAILLSSGPRIVLNQSR